LNLGNKKEDFKNLSDEDLVHRYRNSHETYYVGELYERYTHLVFGVCLKYLKNEAVAEDVTMQVFEKLMTDLKRHHITAFKSWLYVVVKNHCMMQLRKESGDNKKKKEWRNEVSEFMENMEADHLQESEDRGTDKEFILQHLKHGVDELREEQRMCIELFYLKDCSYNEISAITGYSMKEVKSNIQNGKRNLKNFVNAKNDEQGGENKAN